MSSAEHLTVFMGDDLQRNRSERPSEPFQKSTP